MAVDKGELTRSLREDMEPDHEPEHDLASRASDLEHGAASDDLEPGAPSMHQLRDHARQLSAENEEQRSMEWSRLSFTIGQHKILSNISGMIEPGRFDRSLWTIRQWKDYFAEHLGREAKTQRLQTWLWQVRLPQLALTLTLSVFEEILHMLCRMMHCSLLRHLVNASISQPPCGWLKVLVLLRERHSSNSCSPLCHCSDVHPPLLVQSLWKGCPEEKGNAPQLGLSWLQIPRCCS